MHQVLQRLKLFALLKSPRRLVSQRFLVSVAAPEPPQSTQRPLVKLLKDQLRMCAQLDGKNSPAFEPGCFEHMIECPAMLEESDASAFRRRIVGKLQDQPPTTRHNVRKVFESRRRVGQQMCHSEADQRVKFSLDEILQTRSAQICAEETKIRNVLQPGLQLANCAIRDIEQGNMAHLAGQPESGKTAAWTNLEDIEARGQRKTLIEDLVADWKIVKRRPPKIRDPEGGALSPNNRPRDPRRV